MTCCSRTITPRQQLLGATQFGGDPAEITRLLGQYSYPRADLHEAIEHLKSSPTSAAEVNYAQRCIEIIERRLAALK
ncbi:hypothetical protein KKF84_09935 [Myxococcota bacterium]|nr:hypothetical protein [Myxococcota bacterium]MBU1535630.1 hypothetical protein [Myxococcota bacterium]